MEVREEEELQYKPNQPMSAGAREDIKTLLNRTGILFDEYGTLRFQYFSDIFQDMKFSLVFCGRSSFRELYEFTEDLFDLVKQETLSHNKMPIRAAAIYLLYALYFKQPTRPKVRIKLCFSEYKQLSEFVNECKKLRHWEVPYVWSKLAFDEAFHYVAINRPVGLESIAGQETRRAAGLPCGDDKSSAERVHPFKNDDFKSLTKRIDQIHSHYVNMKLALREDSNRDDVGLSMISDQLPKDMMAQYEPPSATTSSKKSDSPGNVLVDDRGMSIGERRKRLKYGNFNDEDDQHLSHRDVSNFYNQIV